jgi:hypothetical protein
MRLDFCVACGQEPDGEGRGDRMTANLCAPRCSNARLVLCHHGGIVRP